jgi:hypothetical protein
MKVIKLRRGVKPAGVLYCGRAYDGWPASPVANPCSARRKPCPACGATHYSADGRVARAGESVECYRRWLFGRIQAGDRGVIGFLKAVPKDAVLGCWCLDAADARTVTECHTGVVARAAEWLQRKSREQQTWG